MTCTCDTSAPKTWNLAMHWEHGGRKVFECGHASHVIARSNNSQTQSSSCSFDRSNATSDGDEGLLQGSMFRVDGSSCPRKEMHIQAKTRREPPSGLLSPAIIFWTCSKRGLKRVVRDPRRWRRSYHAASTAGNALFVLAILLALSGHQPSLGPRIVDCKTLKPAWQWSGQKLYKCDNTTEDRETQCKCYVWDPNAVVKCLETVPEEPEAKTEPSRYDTTVKRYKSCTHDPKTQYPCIDPLDPLDVGCRCEDKCLSFDTGWQPGEATNNGPKCMDSIFSLEDTWSPLNFFFRHDQSPLPSQGPEDTGDDYKCFYNNGTAKLTPEGEHANHVVKVKVTALYGKFNLYDMQALCQYVTIGAIQMCELSKKQIKSASSPTRAQDKLEQLIFSTDQILGKSDVTMTGSFQAVYVAMQALYYKGNLDQNSNRLRARVYNAQASRAVPYEELLYDVSVNENCANDPLGFFQLANLTQLMHIVDINDSPVILHPKDQYVLPIQCQGKSTADVCHFGQFFSDEDTDNAVSITGVEIEDADIKESCTFVNPECAKLDVSVRASRGSVSLNTRSGLTFYEDARESQGFTAFISPSNAAVKVLIYRVELLENIGPNSAILNYNTQHSGNKEDIRVTVSDQGFSGNAGVARVSDIQIDITIIAVNDAPVITVDQLEYNFFEDEYVFMTGISVTDVDVNERVDSSLSRMTWMRPPASQLMLNQLKFRLEVVHGILRLDYTRNMRLIDTAVLSFYTIERYQNFHDTCRIEDIYNDAEALIAAADSSFNVDMTALKKRTYRSGICNYQNIGMQNCETGTEPLCSCSGIFSCAEDGQITLYINNTAEPFLTKPNKLGKRYEDAAKKEAWLTLLGKAVESKDRSCGGMPVYSKPNNFSYGLSCETDNDCNQYVLEACIPGKTCACCANASHICSSDSDCAQLDKGSYCGCTLGGPGHGVCGPYCRNKDLTVGCDTRFLERYQTAPKLYGRQCTFRAPFPNTRVPGAKDPAIRECRSGAFGIVGSTLQKVVDLVAYRSLGSKRITWVAEIVDVQRSLNRILYVTDPNYNRLYRPPIEERDLLTFDIEADHVDTFTLTADDLGNSGGKQLDNKKVQRTVNIRIAAINDQPVARGPASVYAKEDEPFHFDVHANMQASIQVYEPDKDDYGFAKKQFTVNLSCTNGRLYLNESFLQMEGVSGRRIKYKMWDQERRGLHYVSKGVASPKFGNLCQLKPQCSDNEDSKSQDTQYGFFKSALYGTVYSPQTAGALPQGCGVCPEDTGNKFLSIEGVYEDINQALSFVTYLPDPHFNTRSGGRKEEIIFQVNDNGGIGNDASAPALQNELKIQVVVESVNDRPLIGRLVKAKRYLIKYNGRDELPEEVTDSEMRPMNKSLDSQCSRIPPAGEDYWRYCGPGKRQYIDIDEDTEFFIIPDVLWIEDVDSQETEEMEQPRRYCCDPTGLVGCRCGQACTCSGLPCNCRTPQVCQETTPGQLSIHMRVKHGTIQFYPPPGRNLFKQSQLVFLRNTTDVPLEKFGPMEPCPVQRTCMSGVRELNIKAQKKYLQQGLEQMFLTYKPLPNFYGEDELYVWVSDGGHTDECYNASLFTSEVIKIRVVGLNDAPIVSKPDKVMIYDKGLRCYNSFMDFPDDTGLNRECITNPNVSMFPPASIGPSIQFADVDIDDVAYGNITVTFRIGDQGSLHENAGFFTLVKTLERSNVWYVLYRFSGLVHLRVEAALKDMNELMHGLRYDAHPTYQGYIPMMITADDNMNFGECNGDHKCGFDDKCGNHMEAEKHTPVRAGFTKLFLDAVVGASKKCRETDCNKCSLTAGCGFCPGKCAATGGRCMVGDRSGPTYDICEPHPRDGRKWNECTLASSNNLGLYLALVGAFLVDMISLYSFLRWVRRRHGSLTSYLRKKQADFKRAGRRAKILPPIGAKYDMAFLLLILTASLVTCFVVLEMQRGRVDCNFKFRILFDTATSIHLSSDKCKVKFVPTRNMSYPDNVLDALKMQIAIPIEETVVVNTDVCSSAASIKIENKRDSSIRFINWYCNVIIMTPDNTVIPRITIEATGDNVTSVRAGDMDPDSYKFGLRFGPNAFYLKGTHMEARLQNVTAKYFEYDVLHGKLIGVQVKAATAKLASVDGDIVMTTPMQTSVKFWQKQANLVCLTAAKNSLYVDDNCNKICKYIEADRRSFSQSSPNNISLSGLGHGEIRQSRGTTWICTDNGDGTESCKVFDPVQAEIEDTCPLGAKFKKRSEVPRILGCHDLKWCTLDTSAQCLCKPKCDMDATLQPPGTCDAFGRCCQTVCEGYSKADMFPEPDMPRCGRDVNPNFLWCNNTLDQQWNFTSFSGQIAMEVVDPSTGTNTSKVSSYKGSKPASEIDVTVDLLLKDKFNLNEVFHPAGRSSPLSDSFSLRLSGLGAPEAANGEFRWFSTVHPLIWPSWIVSAFSMGLLQPTKGAIKLTLNPSFCPAFTSFESQLFQDRLIQMRKILKDTIETFPGPLKPIPPTSYLVFVPVGAAPKVFKMDPATNKIGVSLVDPTGYPLVVSVVYLALSVAIIATTSIMLFVILSGYKVVRDDRLKEVRHEQLTENLNKVFTVLANVDEDMIPLPPEKVKAMVGRTNFFYLFEFYVLGSAQYQRTFIGDFLVVLYHMAMVVSPALFVWISVDMLKELYQAEKCEFRPDVCACFAHVDDVIQIVNIVNVVIFTFFFVSVLEITMYYLCLPYGILRRLLRFIFYLLNYSILWTSLFNLLIVVLFILLGMLMRPILLAPFAAAIIGTLACSASLFAKLWKFRIRVERAVSKRAQYEKNRLKSVPPLLLDMVISKNIQSSLHANGLSVSKIFLSVFNFSMSMLLIYVFLFIAFYAFTNQNDFIAGMVNTTLVITVALTAQLVFSREGDSDDVKDYVDRMNDSVMKTLSKTFDMLGSQLDLAMKIFKNMQKTSQEAVRGEGAVVEDDSSSLSSHG